MSHFHVLRFTGEIIVFELCLAVSFKTMHGLPVIKLVGPVPVSRHDQEPSPESYRAKGPTWANRMHSFTEGAELNPLVALIINSAHISFAAISIDTAFFSALDASAHKPEV